ncbi:MAG: heparan-alpha-glucosaminide N-acetyltransferase domain-containing protein, partial [Ornithinimicrobium sp.]
MPADRIVGIDVARTLALLGMVVAHLTQPLTDGGEAVSPWHLLVSGRSSALFAVLAGVSITLSTHCWGPDAGHGLRDGARVSLATRAASIAVIGLFLGPLGSGVAVILTYYGVLFLCALPVLTWSARRLGLLAAVWAVASPIMSMRLRAWLPEATYDLPSPTFVLDPALLSSEIMVTGYYPVLTWATYLFAGMAIGRLDLRAPTTAVHLLTTGLWLAVVSVVVSALLTRSRSVGHILLQTYQGFGDISTRADLTRELQLGFFGTTPTDSWWWLGVWSPHSGSIVDLAHTTGAAMAVLGGCLLLTSRLRVRGRRRLSIVAGAGTMTLSLYVVHVVLLAAPEQLEWADRMIVQVSLLMGVGALFAAARARGPLEVLVGELSATAVRATHDTPAARLR